VVPPAEFHDELEYADVRWVRWLAWGTVGVFAGHLCFPIALLGAMVLERLAWLPFWMWVAGSLLLAGGLLLITVRDPAAKVERTISLRRSLRAAALLTLGVEWVMQVLTFEPGGFDLTEVEGWLTPALLLMAAIRTMLMGYFLQTIAERIPNEELGYRMVATTFVLASSSVLTLVLGLMLIGCLMVVPGMIMLGSYVWGLGLMWSFVVDVWSCVLAARSRNAVG
jgi:hypothetical protein